MKAYADSDDHQCFEINSPTAELVEFFAIHLDIFTWYRHWLKGCDYIQFLEQYHVLFIKRNEKPKPCNLIG